GAWHSLSEGSCRFSHDAHFGVQLHALFLRDRLLHALNQRFDIGRARFAMIDDEVGVLLRHRGTADAKALEPRCLYQPGGVIALRIGEHRAAAPLADRLSLAGLVEQFFDRVGVDARLAFEFQARADEPFVVRALHVPIADLIVGGRPRMAHTLAVEHFNLDHMPPGFLAPGAGIHCQCTAERAGNACKEFRRPQAPLDALAREAAAGHAGFGANARRAVPLERSQGPMRRHDRAAHAAVAHQQIAAQADPQQRHFLGQLPDEGSQIHDVARHEKQIRRTAGVPRGVLGHGYVAQDARAEFRRQIQRTLCAHAAAPAAKRLFKSCATWPKLPAPMVRTTSPSCSTARSASASWSTFSTNTGSTSPRLRTARQIARPSAPAIGSSPAAYTSVIKSTSLSPSTRPKSSSRSRVRV